MKVLVFGQDAIGDHISNVLPTAKALHEVGHKVDGVFHNLHGYRLMRETPYFETCLMLNGRSEDGFRDIVEWFAEYDSVYICSKKDYDLIHMWADPKNVVPRKDIEEVLYQPASKLKELGLEYQEGFIDLNIDWYQEHYENFNCSNSSVLLSCTSKPYKSYNRVDELKNLLESKGFDVRIPDITKDVRTNMHLVNQVGYVIAIDSFLMWAAQSLGKPTYLIIHQGKDKHRRSWEVRSGIKNIAPWYDTMDDIPPEVIVENFINSIKSNSVSFL